MEANNKKTIVLADEMALVREGIAEVCEGTGKYQVVGQCGDGAEALPLIYDTQPDVAVIDFNVPRLFSLELVRKIHALAISPQSIILSSRGERKLVLECL